MKTIALASDHAGFSLKTGLLEYLKEKGIPVRDFGTFSEERIDYIDFAVEAVEAVLRGECDRALLVCGTGIGMSMVANKFRGIRAALCLDEYMADMSRRHNDSNCLTLGGRMVPLDEARLIVDTWLDTAFEGGRHADRLKKIEELEINNFK
ncbi:MAG: ribose 5-phosphate isomerase B [Candidatus Aminicenantes bacterium]|nr:ribose 5-phosphate isomerase B [Candidatus Aminicenantes bacterium]